MMTYEFYRRVPIWEEEDRLIGILPERRKDPQRITHQSIINLAKLLAPEDDVLNDKIYFIRNEYFDNLAALKTHPQPLTRSTKAK